MMPLGTQPPALWARESSGGLFLLEQTLSRYSFLDPSVCLLYPKELENHDRIKMRFARCKILNSCLFKDCMF